MLCKDELAHIFVTAISDHLRLKYSSSILTFEQMLHGWLYICETFSITSYTKSANVQFSNFAPLDQPTLYAIFVQVIKLGLQMRSFKYSLG
jgi:hypothetical protein